jgi:lysine 2,3-aminomutase
VLRNYEGVITTYTEPDDYKPVTCDQNCEKCSLQLKLEDNEKTCVGIEKLLTDANDTISLVPKGNLRIERRKKPLTLKAT